MEVAIDIEDLTKTFPSSPTAALSHISAQIPRGQMVGLVGPDGAGKTTLIRLMASLLKPSTGSIRIMGHDTMSAPDAIHSVTGYMPQRFGLYDELTVRQNLTLYFELQNSSLDDREALFERLLNFTRLGPFTERLAKDLSGGMKQKLGLACALLRRPKLLLLDEPSVGVDPLSRRELWDMVQGLIEEGISVIWSTAYLDEAEKCDTILLMNEGEVLFWGPPKRCMERVEGRTFISQNLQQSHRSLLKSLIQDPKITDGVIQGKEVRVVLQPGTCFSDWSKNHSADVSFTSVKPRLEDAIIDILGGAPKHESEFSRLSPDRSQKFHNETLIEVEHLSKVFGSFKAVDDLSCSIQRGEVFGLLGPNGAGKSTTFKMLCGLLKPTEGKAEVLGVDLKTSAPRVREHIGYMAQKFSLYGNISVKQNLEFFAGIYSLQGKRKKEAVENMIDMFMLGPYASTSAEILPLGFKQRLSLACAAIHSPDILFLDEPTSGVDPLMRREFWIHINALVERGVTVMITTHFMDEAEYCDRIAMIYKGKMVQLDSPENLKRGVRTESNPNPTLEQAFIEIIQECDRV